MGAKRYIYIMESKFENSTKVTFEGNKNSIPSSAVFLVNSELILSGKRIVSFFVKNCTRNVFLSGVFFF